MARLTLVHLLPLLLASLAPPRACVDLGSLGNCARCPPDQVPVDGACLPVVQSHHACLVPDPTHGVCLRCAHGYRLFEAGCYRPDSTASKPIVSSTRLASTASKIVDVSGGTTVCSKANVSFFGTAENGFKYCVECGKDSAPIDGKCVAKSSTAAQVCQAVTSSSSNTVCSSCSGFGYFLFEGGCYHVSSELGSKLCYQVTGNNCTLPKPGAYIETNRTLMPCNGVDSKGGSQTDLPADGACMECGLVGEDKVCYRCYGPGYGPINGTCSNPGLPQGTSTLKDGSFTSCISTSPQQQSAYFLYRGGCYSVSLTRRSSARTDPGPMICTTDAFSVSDGICVLPKSAFYTMRNGGSAVTLPCGDVLAGGISNCDECYKTSRIVCTKCKSGFSLFLGVDGEVCEETAYQGCNESFALNTDTVVCKVCSNETEAPINGVCVTPEKATGCEPASSGKCASCAAPYFLFEGGCYTADKAPGSLLCATAGNETGCSVAAPGFYISSDKNSNPATIEACNQKIPACTSCAKKDSDSIWCASCASGSVPINANCVPTTLDIVLSACPEAANDPSATGCSRCVGSFVTYNNGCYDSGYSKIDEICKESKQLSGTPPLTFCTTCSAGLVSVDGICVSNTSEQAKLAGAYPPGSTRSRGRSTAFTQGAPTTCSSGFLLFDGGCYNASSVGVYICPKANQYTIPGWAATLCSGCGKLTSTPPDLILLNGSCTSSSSTPPTLPCSGDNNFTFQNSCFENKTVPGSFICSEVNKSGSCTVLAASANFVYLSGTQIKFCNETFGCMECVGGAVSGDPRCLKCRPGFALTQQGTCLLCTERGGDVNCLQCSSPNGVTVHCDVCKPGYVHNHATETCDPAPCTSNEDCEKTMYCSKGTCRRGIALLNSGTTSCILVDEAGRCLRCLSGHVLSPCGDCRSCREKLLTNPGADPNCASCEPVDVGVTCTACDDGYMLMDGRCIDCSTHIGSHYGCDLCVQGRSSNTTEAPGDFSVCTGCAHSLMAISPDGAQCVPSCGKNSAPINGVCLCDYGYVIGTELNCTEPGGSSPGGIYNTPGLSIAQYCPTGFYTRYVQPPNSGIQIQCTRCQISGCTRCTWHAGREVCTRCPAGRAIYETTCDVRCPANCRQCQVIDGQPSCLECDQGYALNGTACVSMGYDPHCRNYTLIAGTLYCKSCHSGYYSFGGLCVGATTSLTRRIAATSLASDTTSDGVCILGGAGACTGCNNGFVLIEGGCYPKNHAPALFLCAGVNETGNCKDGTSAGAFYGYPGLRLDSDGTFNNNRTGCAKYKNNSGSCDVCDAGYYKDGSVCTPCGDTIQDCAECTLSGNTPMCVLYHTKNTSARTEVGLALWVATTSALIIGIYLWRYSMRAEESSPFHEVLVSSIVLDDHRSFDGVSSFCASTASLV
ncbi:High cysteine membrane protein [Giardia muris]|uniref:High cysteine membrane protein n=1 Tax=Giardia muris TaxID=5742 RepID=A0A4Z1SY05_GIAMU|nr:High cysteine membrane protein [Giardia muris]|eukprot:TNJ26563.1 High cysteine membrane protein [Giardia muris]